MNDVCSDAEMIQLIQGAQRWETAAVDRLYDLYADKVFRYIWYRVGNRETAEDLTMDVFLRLLEHIPAFRLNHERPVSSFSAWLFRIASNRVVDYYRRQGKGEMPVEPRPEVEAILSPAERGQAVVEADETAAELRRAIATLTEEQRQVILYKFVEEMSNADVARLLGKSEGAIKSLQHRALAAIQRALRLPLTRKT
jgi:RNA polymerase sigma-70 factor (ECF subfamily)